MSTSLLGHQRSESYSKIKIDDIADLKQIELEFSIQTSVLRKLQLGLSETWEQEFTNTVLNGFQIENDCNLSKDPFLKKSFSTGYISLFWTLKCNPEDLEINFHAFFQNDPTHSHIATFKINSEPFPEKVFTNSDRFWKEMDKEKPSSANFQSFFDYLNLGFDHILTGYDHLAFLLALLLLNFDLRRLILIITGFTLGHSLTLALGALDLVKPSSQLVEALIGYSIIIIAIETVASLTNAHRLYANSLALISLFLFSLFGLIGIDKFLIGLLGITIFSYCYLILASLKREFSLTFIVTSLFGLIHGFGFAGNLSSIGLMEERLLPAIFGFNIGVELGQLLIVFVLYLIFSAISILIKDKVDLMKALTASALSSVGMFWFLERII